MKTILGGIGLIVVYLVCALVLSLIPVNQDFDSSEEGIEIFVTTNGVHLDICLPVSTANIKWLDFFENGSISLQSQGYVSFGWGERDFYLNTPTWADLTLSTALNAAILPSSSLMHVTTYHGRLRTSEAVRSIRIAPEVYDRLCVDIQQQFAIDHAGNLLPIDCCSYYGERDQFFEANGSYHLFQTCNNWVNRLLKDAGIKTALWSPFDWGVMRYL